MPRSTRIDHAVRRFERRMARGETGSVVVESACSRIDDGIFAKG